MKEDWRAFVEEKKAAATKTNDKTLDRQSSMLQLPYTNIWKTARMLISIMRESQSKFPSPSVNSPKQIWHRRHEWYWSKDCPSTKWQWHVHLTWLLLNVCQELASEHPAWLPASFVLLQGPNTTTCMGVRGADLSDRIGIQSREVGWFLHQNKGFWCRDTS